MRVQAVPRRPYSTRGQEGCSDIKGLYISTCTPCTHLSLATWFAGLLDLAPFHGHAILVRGDELDGPLLWGLSHGWLRRENPIGADGVDGLGGMGRFSLRAGAVSLFGVCPRGI